MSCGRDGRGVPSPRSDYSARYLDRDERYEIARLAGRTPPLSGRRIAARLAGPPRPSAGSWPATPTPAPGATCPSGRTSWPGSGSGARSRLGWPANPALAGGGAEAAGPQVLTEQASGRLKVQFPTTGDAGSHETIYQSLSSTRAGAAAGAEGVAAVGPRRRRPRGRGPEARGKITARVPIGQRRRRCRAGWCPATTRATWSWARWRPTPRSATIVRADHRLPHLLHLPDGHTADAVASAVISRLAEYPAWFARTLTWDNGKEMAATPIHRANRDPGTSLIPTPPGSAAPTRTPRPAREYLPRAPTCPAHRRPSSRHPRRAQRPPQKTVRLLHPTRTAR